MADPPWENGSQDDEGQSSVLQEGLLVSEEDDLLSSEEETEESEGSEEFCDDGSGDSFGEEDSDASLETKYIREMEEQRREDEKNGHFIDDGEFEAEKSRRSTEVRRCSEGLLLPPRGSSPTSGLPTVSSVRVFDRVTTPSSRKHQKKISKSSSASEPHTSATFPRSSNSSAMKRSVVEAQRSRSSARVSDRVATYESSLSARVSDGMSVIFAAKERGKRDSMAAVTPKVNPNLHGNGGADSLCMVNTEKELITEKRESVAVRREERGIPTTLKAAENIHIVGDTEMHDSIVFNEVANLGVNAINEGVNLNVNAFIEEPNQPLSSLTCMVTTLPRGVGSLEDCAHVIGGEGESQDMLPKLSQSLPPQPMVLNVAPLAAFLHEDHANLDLMEVRTLVAHQPGRRHTNGPSILEADDSAQTPSEAQVFPPLSPNNPLTFSHPNFPPGTFFMNPPQLISKPPAQKPQSNIPKPFVSHDRPKQNSNAPFNQPKIQAQSQNSSQHSQPILSLAGKKVAAPLPQRRNSLQSPHRQPSVGPSSSPAPPFTAFSDSPHFLSALPSPRDPNYVGNDSPTATFPQPPPPCSSNQKHDHFNATSRSWADVVDQGQQPHEKRTNDMSHDQPAASVKPSAEQPQIFFGRSMADVLKSGQPAEGPILLDHDRATKRGEVRIVEGKPCLFFSPNETSILAGRIGPAIVGKFSHSIPTAHQIQKALGNLKLCGAMSWNFLNAKHVFIQLSDMRDYVKLLNGPNNSPVWYIEHHPMRVFKWTPDFDPFFENPVVAIWCNILALPVHLFEESALIAIGEMLGHAVQVDRATISRSRVSFARICVEVDISRPIVEEIDLDIAGKRVTLKVKWDKIPMYCNECKHVGHTARNCYAFGKRAMPPKKDYSFGGTSQNRATPQGHGAPSHWGQPSHARPDAGRKEMGPQAQPRAGREPERPHTEHGPKAPGFPFHAGPSGTATAGTPADEDAGFVMPKKKNTSSKAARARRRARLRKMKQQLATAAEVESEGGGVHGTDSQDSASESDTRAGSLSPSNRPRLACDSWAMVAVDSNMFGALEDFPSEDEEEHHTPRIQDTWMVEASASRTRMLELADRGKGHTSPPPEGRLKKARLGASGSQ